MATVSLHAVCAAVAALLVVVQGALHTDVVGGEPIQIQTAKFMVQMFVNLTDDPKDPWGHHWKSYCGGTLLSDYHVLTAGHCVNASSSSSPGYKDTLTVIVGTDDFLARGKTGRKVVVQSFARHPKFSSPADGSDTSSLYDVAVLRLKEAVKPDAMTGTITITKPKQRPAAATTVTVSGWGIYTEDAKDKWSTKLRSTDFTVRSDEDCKKERPKLFFVGPQFCTVQNPTHSTCSGDSGSPAYKGNVQYGIVSWGSCGKDKASSGVLTNLADPDINAFVTDKLKTL